MEMLRMLNRKPLVLPALDSKVTMVSVEYKKYDTGTVRDILQEMPKMLFNKDSGWFFSLSRKGINKMSADLYFEEMKNTSTIHLSAVANLDTLILNAVLGYSKIEEPTRINSNNLEVPKNEKIKANHRFYVGAWINEKPYSVRLMIREYMDGTVMLGEEAKAYALNIKEMRGLSNGLVSVLPASRWVAKPTSVTPSLKSCELGNVSEPSSRCEPTQPTSTSLTNAKLQNLIENNLKEGEESLYKNRELFNYSITGTNQLEVIFDRLNLSYQQREMLYKGISVKVFPTKEKNVQISLSLSADGKLTLASQPSNNKDKNINNKNKIKL